jgi:transcriptional regulator with XRE-family HTH domain
LALTVNIEPEVIEQCEQGQSTITAGLLHQLASALTVPVSYFFEQLPEPNR